MFNFNSFSKITSVAIPKAVSVLLLMYMALVALGNSENAARYGISITAVAIAEILSSGFQPLVLHRYKLTGLLPIIVGAGGILICIITYAYHGGMLQALVLALAVVTAKIFSSIALAENRLLIASLWYQMYVSVMVAEYTIFGSMYSALILVLGLKALVTKKFKSNNNVSDFFFLLSVAPQHLYTRLLLWGAPAYLVFIDSPEQAALLQIYLRVATLFSMPATIYATISMPSKVENLDYKNKSLSIESFSSAAWSTFMLIAILITYEWIESMAFKFLDGMPLFKKIEFILFYLYGTLSGINVGFLGFLNLNDDYRRSNIYVLAIIIFLAIFISFTPVSAINFINIFVFMAFFIMVSSFLRVYKSA